MIGGLIATVGIKGMKSDDLAKQLLDHDRIRTNAINSAGVFGVRITPNVFIQFKELDRLVAAIQRYARRVSLRSE